MTTQFANVVIQPGVPIPPPQGGKQRTGLADVMRGMGVGDSFSVPHNGGKPAKSFSGTAQALGFKICTRALNENGTKVLRVWRIA